MLVMYISILFFIILTENLQTAPQKIKWQNEALKVKSCHFLLLI